MGRTNPTYRDRLRRFEDDWATFRRALRSEHQSHFDELIEHADRFAQAAGHQNPVQAYRGILVSIVLAQEVERHELEERVDELEDRLDNAG